ncbi:ammonium transporter [Acetobacter indonesiensis NRIC 0313]|uniref:Ammonium transporter n=2 Tax=Acetobacter indonesiensis TaxID=104101 RepID=A0A6N3T0H0_9PROT|nr:ammonium transporter [Acetobacter indonesiensis]GBQ60338.1 ammonium transporter [Acetobacter indonesiensis NRIC 0313]GEN02263.1 ammonium transporter [Acetobacter indonesiensis]
MPSVWHNALTGEQKSMALRSFMALPATGGVNKWAVVSAVAGSVLLLPSGFAHAADSAPAIDTGDTAWMLISTALVLMMTIPGLALFYAGMVRKKNVLATLMQSFALCCIMSIVWMVAGYSLAFTTGSPWIGGFSRIFLNGLGAHIHNGADIAFTLGADSPNATTMTIPESIFMMFQMTFAIITPALISGAYAERMKFSAMCVFSVIWSLVVYAPIAHWVWSPIGWLAGLGTADFAGGTVVHINAGIAGLVCALVLGRRKGYGHDDLSPFNLTYAIIGASLLWVGWFGFNAGSAVGANGRAGMAMATTQIAAAGAGVAWMLAEWLRTGKPTVLGVISGAVGGLVAITPAAGFVLPGSALIIGLITGVICFWSATSLKHLLGYDDSLDAFGVHGVGGIVGALLTGLFAYGPLSATDANPTGIVGSLHQFMVQCEAVIVTIIWCGAISFILLKLIDMTIGLRVTADQELEGLDMSLHGERIN